MGERELLTVRETCRLLRVTKGTIYKLIAQGRLPGAVWVNARWRFQREALEAMVAGENPGQVLTARAVDQEDGGSVDRVVAWCAEEEAAEFGPDSMSFLVPAANRRRFEQAARLAGLHVQWE